VQSSRNGSSNEALHFIESATLAVHILQNLFALQLRPHIIILVSTRESRNRSYSS